MPWIERRLTGDTAEHHLLDRPRDAADRTAIGVASIAAVTILFLGGGQDVIADTLHMPVGRVTHVLQVLFLIAPPITWYVTRRSCLALAASARRRPHRALGRRFVRDGGRRLRRTATPATPTESTTAVDAEDAGARSRQ